MSVKIERKKKSKWAEYELKMREEPEMSNSEEEKSTLKENRVKIKEMFLTPLSENEELRMRLNTEKNRNRADG